MQMARWLPPTPVERNLNRYKRDELPASRNEKIYGQNLAGFSVSYRRPCYIIWQTTDIVAQIVSGLDV